MSSPKHLARIAGVFYLLVGIFGGFAEGFVDPKLHVAGNATATAANVVANSELVRMGVVAHLVDGVFFALTAMALYLLLNHVQKNAARVDGDLRCARGRDDLPQCRLPVRGHAGRDRPLVRGRLRGGRIKRSRDDPARHPALRHTRRSSLLRPVAGAARVSRLPVRAVPQGAGRRAGAGHRLVPRGLAHGASCFPTSSSRSSRS